MARVRMILLYDRSMQHGSLVLGTSNKTELLLGYGTLHGDLASAINPLGDLYKTQVRALAVHLKVPLSIRRKPPSADLWPEQTDESELGIAYTTHSASVQDPAREGENHSIASAVMLGRWSSTPSMTAAAAR